MINWPKKEYYWTENKTLCISIPFTWRLPHVRQYITQTSLFGEWDQVLVGGPSVQLMPDYFNDLNFVNTGKHAKGILQKINPQATRTTIGCPNKCKFCAVPKIEGPFRELDDWPNLPIICDNNLLASSPSHFDKVIDRLVEWQWCDFSQGLDCRLLKEYHAKRLAEIINPKIRLALDNLKLKDTWESAFDELRSAGIKKKNIASYILIGFDDSPQEAWNKCDWIEKHHINPLPQWYHSLNQLQKNIVTQDQAILGWTDHERRKIMQWFYKRKYAKD